MSFLVADLDLPSWSVTKPDRRAHIARVCDLVMEWAEEAGVDAQERQRWLDAARLHDALRDAPPDELRKQLPAEYHDWPDLLLHGPAAAARLEREGLRDAGVLNAVRYHTLGHQSLDAAGRALYLADFLEPGRTFDPLGRAAWRARMPHDMTAVLREVLAARIQHIVLSHRPIRLETLAFWNEVTRG
jgi:HD superfamily phosphohydrolase YqeK